MADVPRYRASMVRYVRGRSHEGGYDADGGMYVQSRALDMCTERVTGSRNLREIKSVFPRFETVTCIFF